MLTIEERLVRLAMAAERGGLRLHAVTLSKEDYAELVDDLGERFDGTLHLYDRKIQVLCA